MARATPILDGWKIRLTTSWTLALALLVVSIHARSEEVISTTVCEIIANPAAFNHRLVKLTGTVQEATQQFALSVAPCGAVKVGNWTGIWVEYGGRVRTGAKYCCGNSAATVRDRPSDLRIEGVETSLVENDQFRAYDSRLKAKGHASATLIGRYFSGEKEWMHGGSEYHWGGFGHLGMWSLLVVQEVTCVRSTPLGCREKRYSRRADLSQANFPATHSAEATPAPLETWITVSIVEVWGPCYPSEHCARSWTVRANSSIVTVEKDGKTSSKQLDPADPSSIEAIVGSLDFRHKLQSGFDCPPAHTDFYRTLKVDFSGGRSAQLFVTGCGKDTFPSKLSDILSHY